ncbi:ECF transporter S component [Boudabousia marimammalium]|uniref:ABC transporter permease n=1 Tax=Boudabousia marimammalium TaxID=156892 RepID=A0A1Q5PLZ8_9ACTO|nr:ECF transporter S component [Boudabousia marimammalium]OKL48081.1 ABC transporter permease [Boudabousia marimammalium]
METNNPVENNERQIHTSARKGLADSALGTRNLMVTAALAVLGMILLIPLNYLAPAAGSSPKAVYVGVSIMGLWVIPYLLPATVVRRPGAVMIAALIAGIISVFTTPAGPGAIVGNLIGGAFIEIPLAVMLYRKWTWWAFLISAGFFGFMNGWMYTMLLQVTVGYGSMIPMVLISVASALLGGLAAIGLTKLFNRAGVGFDHKK